MSGQYVGVWRDGALLSVAGIHVFSETYSVAALGNVTTHPDYRGQGLATVATAALCKQLRERVSHISLNVHGDNTRAIRTYERLGFARVAVYGEYTLVGRLARMDAGITSVRLEVIVAYGFGSPALTQLSRFEYQMTH
jgi:ribosomal protein S18 acetylase RimI-like enzyme